MNRSNSIPASLRPALRNLSASQTTPRRMSASLTSLALSSFPQESEDAAITGTTRSLNRRLLALNLSGSLRRPAYS